MEERLERDDGDNSVDKATSESGMVSRGQAPYNPSLETLGRARIISCTILLIAS